MGNVQQAAEKYNVEVGQDNVVHLKDQSFPTEESSSRMKEEFLGAIQKNNVQHAVIDLSAVTTLPTSGTRKNIVEMLKKSGLKKIAIFGATTSIRVVAGFIMKATDMKNMKFFQTEEKAMAWLKES